MKDSYLLLYPCGATIKTKIGSIEGMITCQSIRFGNVKYEISYFSDGKQESIWMHEDEFTTNDTKQTKIGFKP